MSFNENAYRPLTSRPSTAVNSKSLREGEKNNAKTKQKLVTKPQQNFLSLSKTDVMRRPLRKAQNGMQQPAGPEAQIQQIIVAFAQMNQQAPEEIMQSLEGMSSEEQQQAIQQMAQAVQQSQGGGQGQPQMKFGGATHRMPDGTMMPGASHNPNAGAQYAIDNMQGGGIVFDGNTIDFNDVRKNLIKMYKTGGKTDASELDSSSTEAYTTGLKNALQKKLFSGYAMNKVNQRFANGQGAPQFQQLPPQMPMAKDGIEVGPDGVPRWDGTELPQFIKDKYGVETVEELQNMSNYNMIEDPSVENNPEWTDIAVEISKGIWENSDFGKAAMEKGYTFEQTEWSNSPDDLLLDDAGLEKFKTDMAQFTAEAKATAEANQAAIDSVTDMDLQMHNKTREEFDAMTPEEQQNLSRSIGGAAEQAGYTGPTAPPKVDANADITDENVPVVLTPEQEAKKEEERRAALTQEERDAEDQKNAETEYEEGVTYKYVDGKMVAVKDEDPGGDPDAGQANDPDRVKEGWNINGEPQWGMSGRRALNPSFLNAMSNIVNRRQVGVQGSMSPEEFYARQSGISDIDYKSRNGIFGSRERLKISFNPVTGQEELVDEQGNVVETDADGNPVNTEGYNAADAMVTAIDADGNEVQMTQEEAENQGLSHKVNPTQQVNTDAIVTNGLTRKQNRNRAFDTDRSGDIDRWERKEGRKLAGTQRRTERGERRDARKQGRVDRRFGKGWQQSIVDSAGGKPRTATSTKTGEEQIQRGDERGVESNDPSIIINATAGQNDYGNEVDATYNIAEANLRARGIKNPTQAQLNDALDNVEMVRSMSGVAAGEMPPEFRYGGKTGMLEYYIPTSKKGDEVAKFKPLYEYDVDYGAMADVLYEGGSMFNEFLEGMNTVMSPEEERSMQSVDRKFGVVPPSSGDEGLYDRNTGRQLPQDTGADILAGTNRTQGQYGQKGQKFTDDFFGRSSGRLGYGLKHGGLVLAKAGMQVGEELTLTPDQLKMMENLGYKVKQLY